MKRANKRNIQKAKGNNRYFLTVTSFSRGNEEHISFDNLCAQNGHFSSKKALVFIKNKLKFDNFSHFHYQEISYKDYLTNKINFDET